MQNTIVVTSAPSNKEWEQSNSKYHFLINRKGEIQSTDLNVPSLLFDTEWNTKAITVCLVREEDTGHTSEVVYTPEQWGALKLAIITITEEVPSVIYLGGEDDVIFNLHRKNIDRPGFWVYAWYKNTWLFNGGNETPAYLLPIPQEGQTIP